VYRSACGYELLMVALYGRHYRARMAAVAQQVPAGASVLELCCGPGTLYERYLRERVAGYIGMDVNARFIAGLKRRGVDARVLDLAHGCEPLPAVDVVIMQASLYHFLPRPESVVARMLAAARERVVIAEPVRNLATSDVAAVRWLGRRAADPGIGTHEERFTEATLDRLMDRYRERVIAAFLVPGGREKVYVLAAASSSYAPARIGLPGRVGSIGGLGEGEQGRGWVVEVLGGAGCDLLDAEPLGMRECVSRDNPAGDAGAGDQPCSGRRNEAG
jgi:SAM-dependent methyltransferase